MSTASTDTHEVAVVVHEAVSREKKVDAPFLDLLPRELGSDIVYLKGADHYVDVFTTAGSSLIKMRLADVAAELGDRGIHVHRSYWVAHGHMQELIQRDRKPLLRLTGNYEVPVSATYLGAVRAHVRDHHSHDSEEDPTSSDFRGNSRNT